MKALILYSLNLPYFERLVLKNERKRHSVNFVAVVEFIAPFAKGMTRLVALGLFGFPFEPNAAEEIRRRLTEEIVPGREAFGSTWRMTSQKRTIHLFHVFIMIR